jgi:hypothetical protein
MMTEAKNRNITDKNQPGIPELLKIQGTNGTLAA